MMLLMRELINEVRAPMTRPLDYLIHACIGALLGLVMSFPLSLMAAVMGLLGPEVGRLDYFVAGVTGISMIISYLLCAFELMLMRIGRQDILDAIENM